MSVQIIDIEPQDTLHIIFARGYGVVKMPIVGGTISRLRNNRNGATNVAATVQSNDYLAREMTVVATAPYMMMDAGHSANRADFLHGKSVTVTVPYAYIKRIWKIVDTGNDGEISYANPGQVALGAGTRKATKAAIPVVM